MHEHVHRTQCESMLRQLNKFFSRYRKIDVKVSILPFFVDYSFNVLQLLVYETSNVCIHENCFHLRAFVIFGRSIVLSNIIHT